MKKIFIITVALLTILGAGAYALSYQEKTQAVTAMPQEVKAQKKIYHITITDKLVENKEFYAKYFGFAVVYEADWYIHMRDTDGIEIAFMKPNTANQPEILHGAYAGNGIVYSFEVADAQAEYERLKQLGAPIVYELTDEEWGQRHFILKDPAGVSIDVVQQLSQ